MGIKRIVDTSFWTDGKVDEFSPEDKYFMLYLLTCPFTKQLGIYEMSVKQVAFQLGYSVDAVKVLLDRFENKYGIIIYSEETNEIAIKNYLKHSIIKGGAPVRDCLIREMKQVKNTRLIDEIFAHIKGYGSLNATVKNLIAEYEEKNGKLLYSNKKENDIDNEIDNDNENDNEVSSPYRGRIVDVSFPNKPYDEIKTEILNEKEGGKKVCEWCGYQTSILHKHHHPVPKRLGGTETVNICANCHGEFHLKESKLFGDNHTDLTAPQKQNFGVFSNVLLSFEEYTELQKLFPDTYEEHINKFSRGLQAKGYKYENHYAAILQWVENDKNKQVDESQKQQIPRSTGNIFADIANSM